MSTCYSISLADAVKNQYNLSGIAVQKYRFIDVAQFLRNQRFELLAFDESTAEHGKSVFGGIPAEAKPYATVSYPWRDLAALEGSDPTKNAFRTVGLSPDEPPTSLDVLTALCIAAEKAGCKYLWMDKLCFRQDYDQQGIDDRVWQMKRMYSVYEKCKVCLVAAGGMFRLPRLIDRTTWINRAWTLQEALAPPEVQCLFLWNSGGTMRVHGNIHPAVEDIMPGVGSTRLDHLLSTNVYASIPATVKVIENGKEVEKPVLPENPDSEVYYFGCGNEDKKPIIALLGALERRNSAVNPTDAIDDLSSRRLGIWRCITMRSARYAEDFVFATMGIFGVTVEPLIDPKTGQVRKEGYLEDEIQELLDRFLRGLADIGSRVDWLAVAPELGPARETSALPIVPDINYRKDNNGRLATPVKQLITDRNPFQWYLANAVKYSVDAPNGIQITAPAHAIAFAGGLSPPGAARLTVTRCHDEQLFEITDGGDRERYAVVLGNKTRYLGGSFPPMIGDPEVTLLMLVEYMPLTVGRFRNIGYAWAGPDVTDCWQEKTLGVGLRGG